MTQKELYTSPEVAVLTLQSEGVVCQSITTQKKDSMVLVD